MSKSRRGRNEGSISQRADGSWYAQIELPRVNGKRCRKTVSGKTKCDVQKALRAEQNKLADGTLGAVADATVEGLLLRWLETAVKPTVKGSTHASYQRYAVKWLIPVLGKIKVEDLAEDNIEALLRSMEQERKSGRTRQYARGILCKCLDWAVTRKMARRNAAASVARPKATPPEIEVYDQHQSNAFLKAASSERLGSLWSTALLTGMRLGELLSLQWPDVDFKHMRIHVQRTQTLVGKRVEIEVPKTKASKRSIVIGGQLRDILIAHKAELLREGYAASKWVFCDLAGEMLLRSGDALSSFNRIVKAAGIPRIKPHGLRHTHATLLLRAGTNPKIVQERLGHSSIVITLNLYSHVMPDMQGEAVERLDQLLG